MNHSYEPSLSPVQDNLERINDNSPHESSTYPTNTKWDDLKTINHVAENTDDEVHEKILDAMNEQKTKGKSQKVGKKTLATLFKDKKNTTQLAQDLGINHPDISALLEMEGYEKCGIRLGKSIYFTEEDEETISAFFKDRKMTTQLAEKLSVNYSDICALRKTKGYEDCGIKLAKGIYFTEEDEKKIATFFKDKKTTKQLAEEIGINPIDISALINTEGYEDCGIKLDHGIYFTEEDEKKITAFFKDKKTTKQLAEELGANPNDISALLNTEGYEDCGIRLDQGIYFTEEDEKKITAFFKDKKTTTQLARDSGVHRSDISALLNTEGYEDCGIKLDQGIYFTEEDEKKITAFFKDKKTTTQLAEKIGAYPDDISALLKTEGYEDCGIRLYRSIHFTEEDEKKITAFFKDKKTTKQLAEEIGINPIDISALINTEGYENCGIRLAKGIYFTEEDEKKIGTFFKDNKTTKQLAEKIGINPIDIGALRKTKGYEDCGIKLAKGIYFTEEDEKKIATFFKDNKTTTQLAEKIGANPNDISALLNTEGYENCGIRLAKGIYFTEEDEKKIAAFFKDKKTTTQLARDSGVHRSDISALINTEGYEDCGIKLDHGIYFTEEDEKKITAFFKDKKTTDQLARENNFRFNSEEIVQTYGIKGIKLARGVYYDKEQIAEIVDLVGHESPKDSFPETAFRFYLQQAGLKLSGKRFRPDWMKREETGQNLEIDIYIEFDNPPPPGIGIEYDGERWHPNPEYDASKNDIARKSGVEIIHIREKGCPPMRDDIPCIIKQDRKNNSLENCIKQVFEMLHIPLPETGIDVSKKGDRAKILELSGDKEVKAKAYKGIQTNDINRDGADISKTNVA